MHSICKCSISHVQLHAAASGSLMSVDGLSAVVLRNATGTSAAAVAVDIVQSPGLLNSTTTVNVLPPL